VHERATEERKKFLQTQKERIALRNTPASVDAEQALHCIKRQLRSRKQFQRIGKAMRPATQQALTKLQVTQTERYMNPHREGMIVREHTITINVRQELEDAILARNQKHFAQAQGTPLTVEPLSDINSSQGFDLSKDQHGQPFVLPH
jgi:uncharacterized protein YueI